MITFTSRQFSLEGGSIRSKLKSIFRGKTTLDKFLKPASNMANPYIGMVISCKTKNPKIGQVPTSILKSFIGGKFLSLTDMHSGAGLRLQAM